jgi:hypothetical protein
MVAALLANQSGGFPLDPCSGMALSAEGRGSFPWEIMGLAARLGAHSVRFQVLRVGGSSSVCVTHTYWRGCGSVCEKKPGRRSVSL